MTIPVRLPDLQDWKAQVKCQAGCPVSILVGKLLGLLVALSAAELVGFGLAAWIVLPTVAAARRLSRVDL